MDFSLDQLSAFVTAVEEGSFKEAARKLRKHPTTVSQQVANLEIDIGLDLFERQVRKLNLTEAGRDLYLYAKPVMIEAGFLSQKVSGMLAELPSALRLGLGTTVRDRELLRCAQQVMEEFPTISLEVMSGDPIEVLDLVRDKKVDIGVIASLFRHYPGITATPLFAFELVSIGAPGWVGDAPVKSESQLRAFPQIVYRYVEVTESMHGHILSNRHYVVESLADLLDMVSLGLGWAIFPRYQVEDLLARGELLAFSTAGGRTGSWNSELVYRADGEINPAMQRFIEEATKLPDR